MAQSAGTKRAIARWRLLHSRQTHVNLAQCGSWSGHATICRNVFGRKCKRGCTDRMLSRERCLDVWNGLRRSIANFTATEVLQAVRQVALPLSSATALAQVNGTSPLPPGRGLSPFDCFLFLRLGEGTGEVVEQLVCRRRPRHRLIRLAEYQSPRGVLRNVNSRWLQLPLFSLMVNGCPLMAQSRHARCAGECPLLGTKRTVTRCLPISICDYTA